MDSRALKRNNHYVPQFLLHNFAIPTEKSKVMEYQLLVPDERVPSWGKRAIRGIAKHKDLYTISEGISESDELERWLDKNFEWPAGKSVEKVLSQTLLTERDMKLLCNLYAAQFLRTPAHFFAKRNVWSQELNRQAEMMQARIAAERPNLDIADGDTVDIYAPENLPMRIRVSRKSDNFHMLIQTLNGRKLWVWGVKHALRSDGPIRFLQRYEWTILIAPEGQSWFCSDNPAVSSFTHIDGGKTSFANWAHPGARLMLPLSPKHLLYHRVGAPISEQYMKASDMLADQIRRDLADAAHRSIFCHTKDESLSHYRPRKVDLRAFRAEQEAWEKFGSEQWKAEQFRDIDSPIFSVDAR